VSDAPHKARLSGSGHIHHRRRGAGVAPRGVSAATLALEISSRNARVAALQKRWDRLRAGRDQVLDQRGADMAAVPGGASGLLCRDYKGKEADRLVTRIDPGVVSLLAELHGHERQAAEELERWKTHHEERKVVDASPAAVTLALLLTDEELDSLEKRAGDGEIAGRGRKGGSDVASPQPAARHGEPAQVFPANAAAADGRPRLDGVIGWSRICAMAGGAADGRPSLSRFSPMEPGSDPRPAGRGHGRCARRRQRVAGARLQG
jgi:hypothetical protein